MVSQPIGLFLVDLFNVKLLFLFGQNIKRQHLDNRPSIWIVDQLNNNNIKFFGLGGGVAGTNRGNGDKISVTKLDLFISL